MFCQYNVIAVVDWKYKTNGDPMADLGYFLMMFLKPKEIKGLKKLTPLLAGQYATCTLCSGICLWQYTSDQPSICIAVQYPFLETTCP